MLRITIYTTLIVILMLGAASAQTKEQGLPGYRNSLRTDSEKKNDREIDRAYESTIKGRPDAEKRTLIRGAMSVQLHQRRPRTSNNCQPRPPASRHPDLEACFVVHDHCGKKLAEDERERRSAARLLRHLPNAACHARVPVVFRAAPSQNSDVPGQEPLP